MRLRKYLILIIGLARIVLSQDDSWKLFDDSEVDELYITIAVSYTHLTLPTNREV